MVLHNWKKVLQQYPAEMAGERAGWVAVGTLSDGVTPYACVTFFTIGPDGAACGLTEDDRWEYETVHGFIEAVSLATPLIKLPGGEFFTSWGMVQGNASIVMNGDGVYYKEGHGEVTWCNTTSEVWRVLKERLAPYDEAADVFIWLYYMYNLLVGNPEIVRRQHYTHAFGVFAASDLQELQDRTRRDFESASTLVLKIEERLFSAENYDNDEFLVDCEVLAVPSLVRHWGPYDSTERKLEYARNYRDTVGSLGDLEGLTGTS